MNSNRISVAVDASRNRSGGAVAHIVGLMSAGDPRDCGIDIVHLWGYPKLLEAVPDREWLVKHCPFPGKVPILREIWWQFYELPRAISASGCDILFNTSAGTFCLWGPSVSLSQDMLMFEPGEIHRYGGTSRIRLELLRHINAFTLRRAALSVYLTEYARSVISTLIRSDNASLVIPHGINEYFFRAPSERPRLAAGRPTKIVYVSNVAPYKHQWHVIDAMRLLGEAGISTSLTLVGGIDESCRGAVNESISRLDELYSTVKFMGPVSNDALPRIIGEHDVFLFASSCENMPITLLEAMAAGIPICSSDRGPMPEILQQDAFFFDPENANSIADALRDLIGSGDSGFEMAQRAYHRARRFTWSRCASETWAALAQVCNQLKDRKS